MVFAYHDVGVRCLRTLLAHGVEVPLVLTHADAPGENIWFESVAQHAHWHGIEVQRPPIRTRPTSSSSCGSCVRISCAAARVVFAYHDVGVRCLRMLLAHGVDVPLVVTHAGCARREHLVRQRRAPRALARHRGPDARESERARTSSSGCAALRPDFLFSFYYRSMLGRELLALPRAAPTTCTARCCRKYRGRVPVNWAVLHGESETGATLHAMAAKPDAGDIVAQQAVPILPDDTALEVFGKVTVAAELALDRACRR